MKKLFPLILLLSACVPIEQIPEENPYTPTVTHPADLYAMLGSANTQSRRDAVRSFTNAMRLRGAVITNDMIPPLVRAAQDDDDQVRLYALSGLEILSEAEDTRIQHKKFTAILNNDERMYRVVLRAVEDENAQTRLRAVSVMSRAFHERLATEDILNRRIPFERDPRVRTAIIAGLARAPYHHKQTLLHLRNALQGPDTTMRDRVGRRLAQLRDLQSLKIIVAFLRAPNTRLRTDLWNVVGQFKSAATPYLAELNIARAGVTDPTEAAVADAALRTIKRGD